jgi:CubicO group peptidase (beta-lactamase class C family)
VLQAIERPEDVGISTSRLTRVHDFLAEHYVGTLLPGTSLAVARRGQIVYVDHQGYAPDAIVRLYSMTKAVTSVGLMSLYEEGRVQLDDPVHRYIPAWKDLRVYEGGSADRYTTKPCERPMTVRDLLTHCSGLTYDFLADHPVAELYKRRKVQGLPGGTLDLQGTIDALAELPLQFSPGTQWNYSLSTDICGHLCALISGQPLDVFLAERVLRPLDMRDAAFQVSDDNAERFVPCYAYAGRSNPMFLLDDPQRSSFRRPPTFLSGGGGLTGSLRDYHRFVQMLINGGELDGVRVLGRKTVDYMATNHLPSGGDLASMGRPTFNEAIMTGMGFGLGFSVMLDPARAQVVSSVGEYAWGGAASTYFWVDPAEELTVVFLTQLLPSSAHPVRRQLRQLVYQALIA